MRSLGKWLPLVRLRRSSGRYFRLCFNNLIMLYTTVIGSFPLSYSELNFRRALLDQLRAGLDYLALPQLEDFCLIYLREFAAQNCGIEIIDDTPWITSSLKPPKVRRLIDQVGVAVNVIGRFRDEVNLKVQVTGPLTLASVTKVTEDKVALSYPSIVEEFINVVSDIVRQFSRIDFVKVVFVDEPSLPYGSWMGLDDDLLIKSISNPLSVANSYNKLTGVHVCGDVRGFSHILLQTSARILHHEFKGNPLNFNAYSKRDLESYDKILGLGCVQTVVKDEGLPIESVDDIVKFISRGIDVYGVENLFIAPDCGFKGFRELFDEDEAERVASVKMSRMVEAVKLLRELYG